MGRLICFMQGWEYTDFVSDFRLFTNVKSAWWRIWCYFLQTIGNLCSLIYCRVLLRILFIKILEIYNLCGYNYQKVVIPPVQHTPNYWDPGIRPFRQQVPLTPANMAYKEMFVTQFFKNVAKTRALSIELLKHKSRTTTLCLLLD